MAGGFYTGGNATVIMDPPPIVYVRVFHPASGPDRHLRKKAEAVAITARMNAPVRTGALKLGIKVDRKRNERGQYAFGYSVYTPVSYGYYVHEGTGPSPRWPVNRRVMRWRGRESIAVFRDFVMHPGTPAQPFLQNALIAMVG